VEAPAPLPSPEPATEMEIQDGWRLQLSPAALQLTKPGETPYQIPRAEVLDSIERIALDFSTNHAFVVRKPKRRIFKLAAYQAANFSRWLGPDYRPELKHQLAHRMGRAIPLGILYLVTATQDPFSWVLGALILAQGILFKFRPTYWLFLLESLFLLGVMVRSGMNLLVAPTWWQGLILCLVGLLLSLSLGMFARFRRVLRNAPPPA
jgi:hypothetical protein